MAMKIESIRTLGGPNVYLYRPVLVMRLHLEELAGRESREFHGFNERLIALLPGLHTHHCGKGRPGGLIERLAEGTYFGHIVEHVALELSDGVEAPVYFGKTRHTDQPGVYDVIVAYRAEQGMRDLLKVAVDLVEALLRNEEFPLEARLRETRRIISETELGPSTRAIVDAASARGIPWFRIGEESLVQLGYGKYRKHIQAATTSQTGAVAVDISCDKQLTKILLQEAAIPVPQGGVVRSEEEAVAKFREIGGPIVVKPLDGCQGKGVSLNLTTEEEVRRAYRIALDFSATVLVEELIEGRNYRLLVIGGKLVAASERLPAHIVGDGVHSVAELVDIANQDPRRGEGHEKPLTKICLDAIVMAYMERSGLSLEQVPPQGETIFLRDGINLSTGGVARDVTDIVHPTIARLCERAARTVGLDICGVDIMAADISRPLDGGAVIEVNASPGLRMHLYPCEGKRREVGEAIVETLFPGRSPSRIPIIAITGTNGKTTVTRLIAHALSQAGNCVGMTTTDGIYIGGELVMEGDTTGPISARSVLTDPSVDVAVLETARGGIVRRGLGYDWSDIGVMTNIQPDHFGQDGIEDLEDLLQVKSLVAERVREGGTVVLNADDPHLAQLMESRRMGGIPRNVVYFSMNENNRLVGRHTGDGGTAYIVRRDWIVELRGEEEERIVRTAGVPLTMNGAAEYQLQNVLAAIAACRAQGLTIEAVAAAMTGFRGSEHNPGRMNIYRLPGGGHVILDYGHNPEAYRAICRMTSQWEGVRTTAIISAPGDRNNRLIGELGRAAAQGFERIIVAEDHDLRGRHLGEVASILCRSIKEEVPMRDCRIVRHEEDALELELRRIGRDEIIVVFYDEWEPIRRVLNEFRATAVDTIEFPDRQMTERPPVAEGGRARVAHRIIR
jgi:cyanophycin synthetase